MAKNYAPPKEPVNPGAGISTGKRQPVCHAEVGFFLHCNTACAPTARTYVGRVNVFVPVSVTNDKVHPCNG